MGGMDMEEQRGMAAADLACINALAKAELTEEQVQLAADRLLAWS